MLSIKLLHDHLIGFESVDSFLNTALFWFFKFESQNFELNHFIICYENLELLFLKSFFYLLEWLALISIFDFIFALRDTKRVIRQDAFRFFFDNLFILLCLNLFKFFLHIHDLALNLVHFLNFRWFYVLLAQLVKWHVGILWPLFL